MYNKLLDTFILVVKCSSFNKAAEKAYISPTAVKKQMDKLEQQLGIKLFLRSEQGVELTEAGEVIYDKAKDIIALSNEAINLAKKKDIQTIRIGTSLLSPCSNFIELWNRISHNSKYKLKVVPFFDDQLDTVLQNKTCDIIFGVYNLNESYANKLLQLGENTFSIAVPIGHELYNLESCSLSDLNNQKIVIIHKGNSSINDQVRKKIIDNTQHVEIIDTHHLYNINTFNHCEDENLLLLTLNCWVNIHPALKTIPLEISETIPNGLIYNPENKTAGEFIDFIAKAL